MIFNGLKRILKGSGSCSEIKKGFTLKDIVNILMGIGCKKYELLDDHDGIIYSYNEINFLLFVMGDDAFLEICAMGGNMGISFSKVNELNHKFPCVKVSIDEKGDIYFRSHLILAAGVDHEQIRAFIVMGALFTRLMINSIENDRE